MPRLPSILTANVRSLDKKTGHLNDILNDSGVDIAAIQETWIKLSTQDVITSRLHSNYHVISTPRHCEDHLASKRGGGTMILVKKDYATTVQHIKRPALTLDPTAPHVELTIVKFKPKRLPSGYSTCIVVCAYIAEWDKSKQAAAIQELKTAIDATIASNITDNKPLIFVTGDLNGANTSSLKADHCLTQINKAATRKERLLDVILTNAPPDSYKCNNRSAVSTADHATVFATPNNHKATTTKPTKILTRTGKVANVVHCLRNTEWPLQSGMNKPGATVAQPQTMFDDFYSKVSSALDKHMPLKHIKATKDKPWMTPAIKAAISNRQTLFNIGPEASSDHHTATKIVRSMITTRKREFNRTISANSQNYWQAVRQNQKRSDTSITNQIADQLNIGFHKVWPSKQPCLAHLIQPNPTTTPKIFTPATVSQLLKQLKPTATGPDGISAKLLKAARLELAQPITDLLNYSISNSFVPTQWKQAHITPIPKAPHPTLDEWRPISLTAILSKVLERGLVTYIRRSRPDIWQSNEQYGFLPGKSVMDAIAQVVEDWSQAIDKKQQVYAIFFDFAKAFDLVDHCHLLTKLGAQGLLEPWVISWLAAYLTDRKQRVVTSQHNSEWLPVEAGVIQGSVIGPILFILFIHDINKYMPAGVDIKKYADDILNYIIGHTISADLPQQVADAVQRWCADNKMRLNISKCKVMVLSKSPTAASPVFINGVPLDAVSEYKYLGIDMNNQLEWDRQWQRVKKLTGSIPHLVKRLRYLGYKQSALVNVIRSHVLSHFTFSAPLLITSRDEFRREMHSLLKRLLRSANISVPLAKTAYNISSLDTFIEEACVNTLSRILADPAHPLARKLAKSTRSTRAFPYKTGKYNSNAYRDSFVQTTLRIMRDGTRDLYTSSTANNRANQPRAATTKQPQPPMTTANKSVPSTCPHCHRVCKSNAGLANHLKVHRRAKQ